MSVDIFGFASVPLDLHLRKTLGEDTIRNFNQFHSRSFGTAASGLAKGMWLRPQMRPFSSPAWQHDAACNICALMMLIIVAHR